MRVLFELYITFFHLGAIAFVGGYALLPIIQKEIVENHKWATNEEIVDYFAIGQCTPGVIAVNISTFIGYKKKGVLGGIISTLGFVTPSIIIITIISAFVSNFADMEIVKYAFAGIRVCVCVLIFNAVLKIGKSAIIDKITMFICIAVFILSEVMSPILIIILSGLLGILIKKLEKRKL